MQGVGAGAFRRIKVSELEDLLAVSRPRVHQILTKFPHLIRGSRDRSDKESGRGEPDVALDDLLAIGPVRERFDAWQRLVDSHERPVIATTGGKREFIVAVNENAERLVFRHRDELIASSFRALCEGDASTTEHDGDRVLRLRRCLAMSTLLDKVVRFSRRGLPDDLGIAGLPEETRARAEEALSELKTAIPGDWRIVVTQAPIAGENAKAIPVRVRPIFEYRGFKLLALEAGEVAQEMAIATSRLQFLDFERARESMRKELQRYADALAAEANSESCTLFFLSGVLGEDPPPSDEPGPVPPRALIPVGVSGFPKALTKGEYFHDRGGIHGLVSEVVESGEGADIDFKDEPHQKKRLRLQNYLTYRTNSRVGDLYNVVVVPLILGSGDDAIVPAREIVGAIRLVNCLSPGSGEAATVPATKPRLRLMRRHIERAARNLAPMYGQLLASAHRHLLLAMIDDFVLIPTLSEYLDAMVERLQPLKDFGAVVVWRPTDQGESVGMTVLHPGWGDEATWTNALTSGHLGPARAFNRNKIIDVSASDPAAQAAPSAILNGFDVPVRYSAEQDGSIRRFASMGFYNLWAKPGGPYWNELRDLAERLAALVGAKFALHGKIGAH